MGVKRWLVVSLSLVGGVALTLGLLELLNIFYQANVTLQKYGAGFAILTAAPLMGVVGIWLDYLLGTGFLPDD